MNEKKLIAGILETGKKSNIIRNLIGSEPNKKLEG